MTQFLQELFFVLILSLLLRSLRFPSQHHFGTLRCAVPGLHLLCPSTLSAEKRIDKEDGGLLTEPVSNGRIMGKWDGGLARHTVECQSGVDWGNADIVAREPGKRERIKAKKSSRRNWVTTTETSRNESAYDHVEIWKPVLNSFFDREKDCSRQWIIAKVKVHCTSQASDCISHIFWHLLPVHVL